MRALASIENPLCSEQPAREIAAKLLLDVARDGLLAGRAIREPALEALRHDLVERRLLGAAALVTAGRRGAGMRTRGRPRGKRGKRGDHGGPRGVAEYIGARTLLPGGREPPKTTWASGGDI
jgi:hypothetical protein